MMNRPWIPHLARLAGLLVLASAAAAEPAPPGFGCSSSTLELLEQKRWLLEGDMRKTALILERGKRTR